jgi:putative acetyltransferase
MHQLTIRNIAKEDNAALAKVIRTALTEFDANKPGTVYYDSTTDALFELFQKERSCYHVAELNSAIVGGGGIYPTEGLPSDTCELVKMYLSSSARGIGLGRLLIEKCIEQAIENGFKNIYLETMPELKQALDTYAKFGFTYLNAPMGNSGHTGCSLWMIKELCK